MKKAIIASFAMLFAFVMLGGNLLTDPEINTFNVNTSDSKIIWKGHKITGTHHGTIDLVSGNLVFEDGALTGGNFVADMQTITDNDMEPGKGKEKLEGHLKSDDFFSVEKFNTASFEITNVTPTVFKNEYMVKGNLTIKGITQEINFAAKVTEENGVKAAHAKFAVDRSKFDVRYGSKTFYENIGDNVIYDDFDLEITLVANP